MFVSIDFIVVIFTVSQWPGLVNFFVPLSRKWNSRLGLPCDTNAPFKTWMHVLDLRYPKGPQDAIQLVKRNFERFVMSFRINLRGKLSFIAFYLYFFHLTD